jgi:hypothetical protein
MQISKELINILKNQDDVVSKELYKLQANVDNFINGIGYLGVAQDNPSLLSYIPEGRIDRFYIKNLITLSPRIGNKIKTNRVHLMSTGGEYLSIKNNQTATVLYCVYPFVNVKIRIGKKWHTFEKCELSNFKENTIETFEYAFYDPILRQKHAMMARAGRVINKIFGEDKFSKQEIELFSRLFYSNNNALGHRGLSFKVVNGDDIRYWYHQDNYCIDGGSLNSSCMRYDSCEDFFGIYTDNDNVEMLILTNSDNLLIGRALIWHKVYSDSLSEFTLLDRIYTVNSNDEELFKNWAKANGYAYKATQGARETNFYYKGEYYDEDLSVKLSNTYFDKYPYVDTFRYIDREARTVSSKNIGLQMDNYESGIIDQEMVWSEYHDNDYPEEDLYYSDYNNSYILQTVACYSRYHNDYLVEEESYYADGDYFTNTDLIDGVIAMCEIYEEYYRTDDMFQHDGEWYHNDHAEECSYDHEIYPSSFMIEASDGVEVFEDNLDLYEESLIEELEEVNE